MRVGRRAGWWLGWRSMDAAANACHSVIHAALGPELCEAEIALSQNRISSGQLGAPHKAHGRQASRLLRWRRCQILRFLTKVPGSIPHCVRRRGKNSSTRSKKIPIPSRLGSLERAGTRAPRHPYLTFDSLTCRNTASKSLRPPSFAIIL